MTDMLRLEEVLASISLPIPFTKIAYLNFPVQLKLKSFTVSCIMFTPFYTNDEVSWLRNTELLLRLAALSDMRHLWLKRYPSQTWRQH